MLTGTTTTKYVIAKVLIITASHAVSEQLIKELFTRKVACSSGVPFKKEAMRTMQSETEWIVPVLSNYSSRK